MISSKKRILLSAFLAVAFVVLRIAYAFLFSGLDGRTVIFALPELRLSGPFRHITLFGDVSLEGIYRNVQLALPFAITILLFGVLSSFVTEPRIKALASLFPYAKNLLTALSISLTSLSAIAESARRVNFARQLRSESKTSILVPILERVITQAGSVGLRLSRREPEQPVSADLKIRNLRIDSLGPFSVDFQRGSIHVVTGSTGSGKSSLLQAIAGQAKEHFGREVSGEVILGPKKLTSLASASGLVSLVAQFPKDSLSPDDLGPEERSVSSLSHGEAYELAVMRELGRSPSVLLLDEPAAALDAEKLNELLSACVALANQGRIVIIAEHRISSFTGLGAIYWRLEEGRLLPGMSLASPIAATRSNQVVGREKSVEISLSKVSLGNKKIEGVHLEIRQGELVAITGPNGSGKTSFLRMLATASDGLMVHGTKYLGPNPKQVALVPDEVTDFFVTSSLEDELRRADRIAKVQEGFTRETFLSLVSPPDYSFDTHPLDLSVGTQLALATAMQLSHKPQLLLLDEPVQGLDSSARSQLAETLRCIQETGCAVVFATHDLYFAKSIADRVLEIKSGRIEEIGVKTR